MHPLRDKKLHEIFPVLNYFRQEEDQRYDEEQAKAKWKKISRVSMARVSARRLGSKYEGKLSPRGRENLGILDQASKYGKSAFNAFQDITVKNKYTKKILKQSQNVITKIHSSDDPMTELGPGISTYHQLLVMLFTLFLVLAGMHLITIHNFRNFKFYEDGGILLFNSMGNMGFSKTDCVFSSMIKGSKKDIQCNTGQISELVDWGITA